MTQDEIFEHVRSQTRKGISELEAVYNSFKKAGCILLPFDPLLESEIFIRADVTPSESIKTVDFICYCNFIKWRIVVKEDKSGQHLPYLNLSKKGF